MAEKKIAPVSNDQLLSILKSISDNVEEIKKLMQNLVAIQDASLNFRYDSLKKLDADEQRFDEKLKELKKITQRSKP